MKTTRKAPVPRVGHTSARAALALVAVLALAGCGGTNDPGASGNEDQGEKSPLAEYMGDGFMSSSGGGMRIAVRAGGGQGSSEEELAKQRKVEDGTAACMKAAGFEYVAVPPESNPKSKFDDAFNLPPDKFAEQYGYGISTIDWSKPGGEDDTNPNTKIRNALSATAKKAYDKALNGPNATGDGNVIAVPSDGKSSSTGPTDMGCRGKAVEEVYGKRDMLADFSKYESLFKDIDALRKRIESDQRVVDATAAWADCLADAGHAGFNKTDEPREKVSQKLDELTGNDNGGPTGGATPKKGKVTAVGPPSFDKVDAQKLADLRKFEIELAKADQGCKAKVYDEPYKKAQYEQETEFVASHKAELEAYRDGMAER
ncbi:hypothetical protein [Kribbella sp. VKM Ac-2568]|uniref:hypothetical protein n=1 Tax=Kribbella sp. VKM Ac-2568 TaxID=2512219 RepID=UPI0010510727|nr:hypothetical protein [Kribbella sp. VKM Ac-2568]TCM45796.1 hypothetical protein EV648_106260 [Kribbella sp. VKM Ac-2568]